MDYGKVLEDLERSGNKRCLKEILHDGRFVISGENRMLNLSSNDYLGLAVDEKLREEFLKQIPHEEFLFSSSSSRLLSGNYRIYSEFEEYLAKAFGSEAAIIFGSGYHANTGILPAICDNETFIIADKFVHASIIDGIRLSGCSFARFKHLDYGHLEDIIKEKRKLYSDIIVVVESIYSMDGDLTDLRKLVMMKMLYPEVRLYVDEAHAVGVRGERGLGLAEEQGVVKDIDFLCGTFGKALASVGAYLICNNDVKQLLINRMRTFIFTTALPPLNISWSFFVFKKLPYFFCERCCLEQFSSSVRTKVKEKGVGCVSKSHIIPIVLGDSELAVKKAEQMRDLGFFVLPVRPPAVPVGSARLRISLSAGMSDSEVNRLLDVINIVLE